MTFITLFYFYTKKLFIAKMEKNAKKIFCVRTGASGYPGNFLKTDFRIFKNDSHQKLKIYTEEFFQKLFLQSALLLRRYKVF